MLPSSIPTIASRNLTGRTTVLRAVQAMMGHHHPLTAPTTTVPVCHRQFSSLLHQQNFAADNNTAIETISRIHGHSYKSTPYRTMSTDESKTTASSQTPPSDSDSDTSDPPSEEADEETETQQLQRQVTDLKDQLLRSLAEQENIRRIARRDVDNSKSYAVTSFAKSLLDTSDNLSRALEAVPEEHRGGGGDNPVLANLYEGIEMTDAGLTKALVKNGLVKFGAVGDVFDPNRHEALFEYAEEEKEAGTVGQVMKVGFELNSRVIRPAEVGVVKKS